MKQTKKDFKKDNVFDSLEIMGIKYVEYGVEIEKKDHFRVEKSQIKDITTDQTRIDSIVKSLMKNNVTPIHLHDVIEDML